MSDEPINDNSVVPKAAPDDRRAGRRDETIQAYAAMRDSEREGREGEGNAPS